MSFSLVINENIVNSTRCVFHYYYFWTTRHRAIVWHCLLFTICLNSHQNNHIYFGGPHQPEKIYRKIVIPAQINNGRNEMYEICLFIIYLFIYRHLGRNPFSCDCNLRWLSDYLHKNPIETSAARCESPKKLQKRRIDGLSNDKFKCKYFACISVPRIIEYYYKTTVNFFQIVNNSDSFWFFLFFIHEIKIYSYTQTINTIIARKHGVL